MTLRDDIVDRERLEEIPVTVLETEKVFNSALAWKLFVEDDTGNEFGVKIWHTHDVDEWWREGWRYILKNGRGKHTCKDNILLHSTDDFTVQRPEETINLLAIGDSHIGRENRPEDDGAPFRTGRQFVAAMGYATRYDVDAVIHAGDLFDENPTAEDITIAESGFEILKKHGIPFYFIYGNHSVDVAKTLYDRISDVESSHLDSRGVVLDDTIEILGVDYATTEEFPTAPSSFDATPNLAKRILVVHDEITPPRGENEIPVSDLCASPQLDLDYIISGHLHASESGTCSGTKIQYLGSTANISANRSAVDQSAWLIRVTPNELDIDRLKLE